MKQYIKTYEQVVNKFTYPQIINVIKDIFKKHGYKTYLVGGCVRDFINGDTPKDFDIATNAKPDKIIELLNPFFRLNLQGEKFGVVVAYHKTVPEGIEIATFRQDVTKGRNPDVSFDVDIDGDVTRRDLTYNGLFYDLDTKKVVDLVGGLDDLKNKITRMIGNPQERIEEDYLRILRVLRFAVRFDHQIDSLTYMAICNNIKGLDTISKERIYDEFVKTIESKNANLLRYFDLLEKTKLGTVMFPKLHLDYDGVKRAIPSKNIVLILANFLKLNNYKNVEKVLKQLKYPSYIASQVSFLISLWEFNVNNLIDYDRAMKQNKIERSLINDYIELNKTYIPNTKMLSKLPKWFIKTNGDDVALELGLDLKKDGVIIGKEIKKREIENYEKL